MVHIVLIVIAVLFIRHEVIKFCDGIQRSIKNLSPRDRRCDTLMYGIEEYAPRPVFPKPTPEQLAYSQRWKDIGRKRMGN